MAVEWTPEELMRRLRIGAGRGVLIGAQLVLERGTQLIMDPPKSGRVYVRRGVSHQASAPGEAPANDTTRLAGSGDVIPNLPELSAKVNWSTQYARDLEMGTRHMEPRSYARRSLVEQRQAIEDAVSAQIAAALQ